MTETTPPKKFIGSFSLAMISVAAIISLRNLPISALQGTKALTFFIAAAFFFFIPIALCCAELSSGWPKKGGIYMWVKEAFGPKWGVFTIWLEWIGSVVWLPSIVTFLSSTTAYVFNPELVETKLFLVSVMLCYLWGATLINFRGLNISSWVSSAGVLIGSILPALILIGLGATDINEGLQMGRLDFSLDAILPEMHFAALVTITALLLGFAGMEIPAYYVQYVRNPRNDYPRAMLLATVIILSISILGSLAITAVLPKSSISIVSGTMQAFHQFFLEFNLPFATPFLAGFMVIGGVALLNTWIIGPSRGLLASAEEGDIPQVFQKTNKRDVPVVLLLLQAIVGSILISVFVFYPNDTAFWILNTLASQLYMLMYSMVFAATIRLRYCQPETKRAYQIPGGKCGIWVVGGLGLFACSSAFVIGFALPLDIHIPMTATQFAMTLLVGITVFCLPPFLYHKKTTTAIT